MRNASFLFSNSFPHLFFLGLYSGLLKVKVKVAQSCLTLCNPTDCSLLGSSVHGILQTGILWVSVKSFSSVWLFATPWTVAYQVPLSMGFSRKEYLNGLSLPPPGYLPIAGIALVTLALQVDSLPLSHWGSLTLVICELKSYVNIAYILKQYYWF